MYPLLYVSPKSYLRTPTSTLHHTCTFEFRSVLGYLAGDPGPTFSRG